MGRYSYRVFWGQTVCHQRAGIRLYQSSYGIWGHRAPSFCEFRCKRVVMRWTKNQVGQNEVPEECELWDASRCSSNSQARSIFYLLASWFHLYLRKGKEFCSGNVSPCSQVLFLSSWWTGMEGMHFLAGISWCPGTNEVIFSSVLSGLWGKNCGGRDTVQGEGCRTSCLSFSQLSLFSGFQQWRLAQQTWKPGMCLMMEAEWPVGGKVNLHCKSGAGWKDFACPGYILPKKGFSLPCAVNQSWLHPNWEAWYSLCFCFQTDGFSWLAGG